MINLLIIQQLPMNEIINMTRKEFPGIIRRLVFLNHFSDIMVSRSFIKAHMIGLLSNDKKNAFIINAAKRLLDVEGKEHNKYPTKGQ